MLAALSVGFAGLATVLAATGLYAVVVYNVTRRTREFGLRLALGADPRQLRSLVLKRVGVIGLCGTLLGAAGAIALARVARSLLFGVSAHDATVLTTAALIVCVVVLLASYKPAQTAARTAPMEALTYE